MIVVYFRVINNDYAQVIINCKSVCVVTKKECAKLELVLQALGIPYESIDMRKK
jgi:hypothetical protein